MKKIMVVLVLFFSVSLFANTGKSLANSLGISASSKASSQWKRIFKKEKKMKKYGIDKLSDSDKALLKEYLMNHAADSDNPEAAGI
jgi:alkyl hydroperoxide reductase subunit AhpC